MEIADKTISDNILCNNNFLPIIGTLSGVVIGFLIGIIKDLITNKIAVNNKKRAICEELEINLGIIPQKIDILNQVIISLRNIRMLPAQSAHFITNIYISNIIEISNEYNKIERSNLHNIYERLNFTDSFMDNFEEKFNSTQYINDLTIKRDHFIGLCEDVVEQLELTKELINEFLQGKPRDVLWPSE